MTIAVTTPPNTIARIDRLYAYLSRDAAGNEGVCAGPIGPGGMMLPFVAADQARLQSLTPLAEQIAQVTGMTIVLVEFSTRTELREIKGKSDG